MVWFITVELLDSSDTVLVSNSTVHPKAVNRYPAIQVGKLILKTQSDGATIDWATVRVTAKKV